MEPAATSVLSSHGSLLLAMGGVGFIGILHLGFARSGGRGHAWVALWCLIALIHQAARYAQLHTLDPETAVLAARLFVASGALMIVAVVGFAASLGEPSEGARRLVRSVTLGSLAVAGLTLFTPALIPGQTFPRTDWFGNDYIGAPASPAVLLVLPLIGAGLAFVLGEVRKADFGLAPQRVLVASFAAYAGMAALSVLSGMRLISIPTTVEYGPLVVALGLNHLLIDLHRRLEKGLHDMVDERTAEIAATNARLAESELRYRNVIENAPIGVFAMDHEGTLVAMNPRLRELMGMPDEVQEVGRLNLLTFPLLIESGISDALERCVESGRVVQGEHRYRSTWGAEAEARLTLAPTRDAQGATTGVIGLVEDVTERRTLERCLRQSQKMESVGQLAAGLAHEINNPMAYVRANLAALRGEWDALRPALEKETLPEDVQQHLVEWEELIDDSLEGVDRTVAIVRDMREFTHGGAGRREWADLNALVEGSVRVATSHRDARVHVDERYEAIPLVSCEPGPLRQVFVNLLVNAIHAVGDSGAIRVETSCRNGFAQVRVRDDGCGMGPEVVERIFDPFFTTKEAGDGTGLGLYVSWEIVSLHGGRILVDSDPGAGSLFVVELPLEGPRPAA